MPTEREVILAAFEQGRWAAQADKPRADNPHMPSDLQYDAWNCGFDEEEPTYKLP